MFGQKLSDLMADDLLPVELEVSCVTLSWGMVIGGRGEEQIDREKERLRFIWAIFM